MKFLLGIITTTFIAYSIKAQQPVTYYPPYFADSSIRLEKIKTALPLIDKIYTEYAQQNHFSSIAYGIVVDGKLIHTNYIGFINIEKKINANNQSAYRIASMTKSFTAMAILKLRDEGKLQLDDVASKYIPELKNQFYTTKDAPPITIRHLLTHMAGFPEDNPWGDRQLARTDNELMQLLNKKLSFSNNAGVAYEYSNLGFTLLGYIIKKVSGLSYENYITKNILQPLGMNHTYWEYNNVSTNNLVHGYRWLNNNYVEQPLLHDGAFGAMGGMITTIEDFSKYVIFNLSVWPPNNNKEIGPVKRSSVREMHHAWNFSALNTNFKYATGRATPLATAYGYGLRWSKDGEGRVSIGHTGGLPGFGSNWSILPDYGIGVILFANATYASTAYINTQVLDTLIAVAQLQPRQLKPSSILEERKQQLLTLLPNWNNAEATNIFADNFFLDYFIDSLQKEATTIFNKAGKILQVKNMIPGNNLRGSFIIECANNNIEISFTLTPENPALIQEYHIKLIKK